ncbi:MAG: tetratricopeptide repeat protein [Sulfurovaceae bacterium]|nr:tetratricopeptide repeat protein [Sulfurovaceae bacterium]MDD5548052.1 tetratricopeptide repeat protein [Sulfurovaceae bacterium]
MNRVILVFFLFFNIVYGDSELQDWSGARVDEVYQGKEDIYKLACEKNNNEACFTLGLINLQNYAQNNKDKTSLKNSIYYLDNACKQNHEQSCVALGLLYFSTSFEKRDENLGLYYLDKSCKIGNVSACLNLAKYYEDEKHSDIQKTINYLNIACDKKNNEACSYAGILYHDGRNTGVDYTKAIFYYKKSISIEPSISSNYLNIFEINLVENKVFDKKIETTFLNKFKKDKQSMMFYDMLKIFQSAKLNKKYNLSLWKNKYKNMNLNDWDFGTIDKWIETTKDDKIKIKLLKIVNEFKNIKHLN